MKKILAGAVAIVTGAVALPSSAQEATQFGAAGQFAIDAQGGEQLYAYPWGAVDPGGRGGVNLTYADYGMTPFVGWSFRRFSQPTVGNNEHDDFKTSAFYLNPGVDYFVIDHLSIGGEVLFALTGSSVTRHRFGQPDITADGPSGTHFGIMPRVGYDIPLSEMFSIWPRGGIGWRHASFSGGGQPDVTVNAWFFYADVYFMFHFAEHFFAGVGPGVTLSLSSTYSSGPISGDSNGYTDIRLISTTLGGYF